MLCLLSPMILSILGMLSDRMSDMSPECFRGIEHAVFTVMLNL